ncbi:MAG: histidine phosphatase family protein [Bacteroidia bacterium]|nr:histidine phosphatase family protein [Bacteroidia bacterium]
MKTLIICRHAKSDWSYDLPDFDRPLNKRGKRDAPRMGEAVAEFGIRPDLIISSPAARAKATAEAVAKKVGYDPGKIRFDRSIYDDGPGNLLGLIQDLAPDLQTVMVFGHNPTQETLARMILGARASLAMPTGSMVALDVGVNSWKQIAPENCGLKWFLVPRLLENLGS